MGLSDDVSRIAAVAAAHAAPGQEVAAVLAVESVVGQRIYLSAFADAAGSHEWLALTDDGTAVTDREALREAASLAALVEIAEEAAERVVDGPRLASAAYLDSVGGDSSLAAALPAVGFSGRR